MHLYILKGNDVTRKALHLYAYAKQILEDELM